MSLSLTFIAWGCSFFSASLTQPGFPGDCDFDGDIDLADWVVVFDMLTGPMGLSTGGLECADVDSDGDVDLADVTAFAAMFTGGMARPANPGQPTDLNVTVRANGSTAIAVPPGAAVTYEVVGELSHSGNEGLAFVGFDLEFDGGSLSQADEPTELPMSNFVTPDGITNPAGYGGTLQDGKLIQIGGGQNTIMNGQGPCTSDADCSTGSECDDSPPPPWVCTPVTPIPVGTVVTGVALPGSPVVLVTGSLTAPMAEGTYTLWLTNLFANVIKEGETGFPCWAVEAAGPGMITPLTITIGAFPDCNGNGVPDDHDIAEGTSRDCQPNGIPDECDIADGTSRDRFPKTWNGDGIPDECQMHQPTPVSRKRGVSR